jgi:hypothetical protein
MFLSSSPQKSRAGRSGAHIAGAKALKQARLRASLRIGFQTKDARQSVLKFFFKQRNGSARAGCGPLKSLFFCGAERMSNILGLSLPESIFSDVRRMITYAFQSARDENDVEIGRHLLRIDAHSFG